MTRPIQTLPVGLLGSLGLKSMGKNPPDFRDEVNGTIDMWRLYMEASATWSAAGNVDLPIGTTGLTRGTPLTPADNEVWWIHGGELTLAASIGATATLASVRLDRYLLADSAKHQTIVSTFETAIAAGLTFREISLAVPGGFLLLPGEGISPVAAAENVAVGGLGVRYQVRYTAFPT